MKTFNNTPNSPTKDNVSDLKTYGIPNQWKLISKAWSDQEGWMKSTKALEIKDVGCLVQVSTQQRNTDGSYTLSENITFVPGIHIIRLDNTENIIIYQLSRKSFDDDTYLKHY